MKRILIIGCGGAGKSTVAKQLAALLQVELIHLDYYYWQPGWKASTSEEWKIKVKQLIAGEAWIMDGNYGGTMAIRAERADTIIFLDVAPWRCLLGITKRLVKYYGKTRPSMPENCPEKISAEFFWYVLNYRRTRQPKILENLETYKKEGKEIFIFTNRQEIKSWLNTLGRSA